MPQLKRYLIERDIPGVGGMSLVELCGAARASNRAIEQIGSGSAAGRLSGSTATLLETDLLHLPRHERGGDQKARGAQWHSGYANR